MDEKEKATIESIRFLSFRPRTKKEVIDFLAKKKYPSQIVTHVLSFLEEKNFLDDRKFIRWWISQRQTFKPRSFRTITYELMQKGIEKELIEEELSDQSGAVKEEPIANDFEMARKIAHTKLKKFMILPRKERMVKIGPRLSRLGFSYEIIRKVIDEDSSHTI